MPIAIKLRHILLLLSVLLLSAPAAVAQDRQTRYDEITQDVAEVRQLDVLEPIELTPQSRTELGASLKEDLAVDFPESEQYKDERELIAFGLMDPDTDLGDLYIDLYTEQVAGYYDIETGEMVVIRDQSDDPELTPSEEVTYAHEVVHALQDQHFDLDGGDLSREDLSDDQALAITALIEGDASYSELQYLLGRPELLTDFVDEVQGTEINTEVLDSAPPLISGTLLFPYDSGYPFVEALFDEGGWDQVDNAFLNPPQSTEQILHPEKYLAGEAPESVVVPDFTSALGDDWDVFDINTFGEYQIRIILEQASLPDAQAARAAAGWSGDTYVVAGTDDTDAIHWVSTWDTDEDAIEFAKALATYESDRWNVSPTYSGDSVMRFEADGVVSQIVLDGDTVTYIKAPDDATLELIQSGAGSIPATPAMATPAS